MAREEMSHMDEQKKRADRIGKRVGAMEVPSIDPYRT
jgi:hypothetical protein